MPTSIDPEASIGWVELTVADLARSLQFYQAALGLEVIGEPLDGTVALGAAKKLLVRLIEQPGARPRPPRHRGLYHFAVLFPTRRDLAEAVARLARHRWPIDGAADHWVSEAIYLSDPDGHGIELYADRPRQRWPRRDGKLLMATEELDFDSLIAELGERGVTAQAGGGPGSAEGARTQTVPTGTRIGHIHLHVSRLDRAEAFYREVLGFELVLRYGPSATFLAAGGYHHHIGANTWAGVDAPPPPADAVQLRAFSIELPSAQAVQRLSDQVRAAGLEVSGMEVARGREGGGFAVFDHDGNRVVIEQAESSRPS